MKRAWLAAVVAATAIGIGLLMAAMVATRLNGDVQYVLGGLSVAGDVGWVETFVHRPILYRLVVSTLNVGALVSGNSIVDQFGYETAIRVGGSFISAAAGAALWRALAPRLGAVTAARSAPRRPLRSSSLPRTTTCRPSGWRPPWR